MTDREIFEHLRKLPTSERLKIVESTVHELREELQAGVKQREGRLMEAAQALLADYATDPELTVFAALDTEPFHA